jgi:hypothetical protein
MRAAYERIRVLLNPLYVCYATYRASDVDPCMTDSKGIRVPMIKDRVAGFTRIAERPRAITTVRAQRKFLQELDKSDDKDQVISEKIIMSALSSAEPKEGVFGCLASMHSAER